MRKNQFAFRFLMWLGTFIYYIKVRNQLIRDMAIYLNKEK